MPTVTAPPPADETTTSGAPEAGSPQRAGRRILRTLLVAVVAVVTLIALGNLAILAAVAWARQTVETAPVDPVEGIENFRAVTPDLWRGSAPDPAAYEALAERGVTTVVDLRAESTTQDRAAARAAGLEVHWLPIRDGQPPTAGQVADFGEIVEGGTAPIFVHCQAGVGRTGSMIAAHLVATGQAQPAAALARSLAVGPPSLEQIAFMAGNERGQVVRPPAMLVATSRLLDAPRRIWSHLDL